MAEHRDRKYKGQRSSYVRIRMELLASRLLDGKMRTKQYLSFSFSVSEMWLSFLDLVRLIDQTFVKLGFAVKRESMSTLKERYAAARKKIDNDARIPGESEHKEILRRRTHLRTVLSSKPQGQSIRVYEKHLPVITKRISAGDFFRLPQEIRERLVRYLVLGDESARTQLVGLGLTWARYKKGDPLSLFKYRLRRWRKEHAQLDQGTDQPTREIHDAGNGEGDSDTSQDGGPAL